MAQNGGRRPGAGRPKGSIVKPKITDYMTPKEINEILETVKKKAREGDPTILKMVIEQIFGRAAQSIDLGNKDDSPLKITWEK